MRSKLPTLELDAVFEAKEEVAVDVKSSLTEIMTTYGYQIVQVTTTITIQKYLYIYYIFGSLINHFVLNFFSYFNMTFFI